MLEFHGRTDPVVLDRLVGVHHDGVALTCVDVDSIDNLRDMVDTIHLLNWG
jgi:hypothetical protein